MSNVAWTMVVIFSVPFAFLAGAVMSGASKLNKIQELYDEINRLRERHNDPNRQTVKGGQWAA